MNERWNALEAPSDKLYIWDPKSTYIKSPPFFEGLVKMFLKLLMFSQKDIFENLHHMWR